MQMSKNEDRFIINLVKLPNGYVFDSVQQPVSSTSKKKNQSKDKSKNTNTKTIHRIFRELALDPQQPQEFMNPQIQDTEPVRKVLEPQPDEEISVELKRQNGLPQSPATWFKDDEIAQIQKDSLPEFFTGKTYKTQGLYKKYRDFIVALYRKNPLEYLTKIACRRILRGDACTIMKIHSFLQKEGVINFSVSKQGNYTFQISNLKKSLLPDPKLSKQIQNIPQTDQQKSTETIDITNITVTTVNKTFSKSNRIFCSMCSTVCGVFWFKNQQQGKQDQNICFQCYDTLDEGQAKNYVKVDIVKKIEGQAGQAHDNKNVWSIDDNLKLLNFISRPNDSWEPLESSFEKKKSFDDIVLQFMQFPISNLEKDKDKPIPPVLEDNAQSHASKLLERWRNSSFNSKMESEKPREDLNDPNFTRNMVKLTKSFTQKLLNRIKSNIDVQNLVEQRMYELSAFKVYSKKKILDQLPMKNQGVSHSSLSNDNISSDNENENENDNDNENEENQQSNLNGNLNSNANENEQQNGKEHENEQNQNQNQIQEHLQVEQEDKGYQIDDFMNNMTYH